ncbi:MAG: glycosyltransferase [Deltaproteobacteria bacterium]|nr:glycosyltransferase [Deltaproteobacteria bacterium]
MAEHFDVVVGIPSYKEESTIKNVAEMASRGLEIYFPGEKAVIVNCDNASPDGTREAFLSAETSAPKKYISTPEGVRGKGANFENLFSFFLSSGAGWGLVVDADIRSITPEWIRHLGEPVAEKGFDLVTPLYARHQFDGTITNHLVYPLVFALAGVDVRQPIGGDFAFSRRMCAHWTRQEWSAHVRQYGIDVYMTLKAIMGGFAICESGLGSKVHKASAPKVGEMFTQVVYTLFSLLAEKAGVCEDPCMGGEVPSAWDGSRVRRVERFVPPRVRTDQGSGGKTPFPLRPFPHAHHVRHGPLQYGRHALVPAGVHPVLRV